MTLALGPMLLTGCTTTKIYPVQVQPILREQQFFLVPQEHPAPLYDPDCKVFHCDKHNET